MKLDGVNTLANRLISQDHSGSTEIQKSLDKPNSRCTLHKVYMQLLKNSQPYAYICA